MIDDDLIQQLLGPSSLLLATAAGGRPAMTRSAGTRLEGGLLRVPLLLSRSTWALDAVRSNPQVALLYTRTDCLSSFQIKGTAVDLVPIEADDVAVAHAHFDAFAASLRRIDPNRDFSNMIIDADVVLRVRPERVFDQTPGPSAGALLRYSQDVRPPWRGLGADFALRPPPAASVLANASVFDGSVPPTLITVDAAGMPNAIYVSRADVLDRSHVVLSRQFFRKTAENLARNPHAVINVGDPVTNQMYVLEARHVRTETTGPLFDRIAAEIDAIASLIGASGIFRLQAADVFEVLAERELDGFIREAPGAAPGAP